jgi:hypothetical protein
MCRNRQKTESSSSLLFAFYSPRDHFSLHFILLLRYQLSTEVPSPLSFPLCDPWPPDSMPFASFPSCKYIDTGSNGEFWFVYFCCYSPLTQCPFLAIFYFSINISTLHRRTNPQHLASDTLLHLGLQMLCNSVPSLGWLQKMQAVNKRRVPVHC